MIAAQFKAAMTAADTTRPITANTEWSVGSSDTLTNILDVMTTSYNYASYENYHRHHPFRPFMGGESASCIGDRGFYAPTNLTAGLVNSDASPACVAAAWGAAASTEWASGNVAWTGFDYKGEPGPASWPSVSSHFGTCDIAGFEKDRAAYYKSWWLPTGATMIHLAPQDWTAPVPLGMPVRVYAFTSAAWAEAFLNGISLGRVQVPRWGYADWGSANFTGGNLTAVAYDASGREVARDSVLPVGPPAALVLTLEDSQGLPYLADGADVALVRCAVVDASGTLVPGAAPLLTFSVLGPGSVYGVGNGNPADLTSDKVGQADLPFGGVWARRAFMGLARAIVRTAAGQPGNITLTATSPGLSPGQVSFVST